MARPPVGNSALAIIAGLRTVRRLLAQPPTSRVSPRHDRAPASMIRRYIPCQNRHVPDSRLRKVIKSADHHKAKVA
jgi:hypothetical protein